MAPFMDTAGAVDGTISLWPHVLAKFLRIIYQQQINQYFAYTHEFTHDALCLVAIAELWSLQ